jgi:CubicO group peptidase (beta-lactamase class C family)
VPTDYSVDAIRFPLTFEPDQGWTYGHGIDWTGQVIEAVAGCTLEDYMQRNIFSPLDMTSSTMHIAEYPGLDTRRAAVGFRSAPDVAPSGMSQDLAPRHTQIDYGGVSLFTTQADYARLLGALLTGGVPILCRQTMDELLSPQLKDTSFLQKYCDGPFHFAITPELPVGLPINHTLAGAINEKDVPGKRRKDTAMWSGLTNPRW